MKINLRYFVGQRLLFTPDEHTGIEPYVVTVEKVGQNNAELSNGARVGSSGHMTGNCDGKYCEAGYVDDCVAVL